MGVKTYQSKLTGQNVKIDEEKYFVAKGGEGSVFVLPNIAYKICLPGKMIPQQKLDELAILDHPNIIVPRDILLKNGTPVGYSFAPVPNDPKPLAEILTKKFRIRENVSPDQMAKLVLKLADIFRYVHSKKNYLIVDANEFNFMIPKSIDDVFGIDTNSYQTPNYPAEVIMPSIRDWHVERKNGLYVFTQNSDWYSFSILSWYMFTGIHPFRGTHPKFTDKKTFMTEQMKACKSVLDPDAQYPLGAVFHPFEDFIPGGLNGAYMQWFRSIFVDNNRSAPPMDYQAAIKFILKINEIIGSDNFDMKEIRRFASQITGYFQIKTRDVVVTRDKIYLGGKEVARMAKSIRIGFTEASGIPFAAWIENEKLQLFDLDNEIPIPIDLYAKNLMACGGRVYVQGENNICEIAFTEIGQKVIPTPLPLASVMPSATKMYQGVVIQNVFNKFIVSVFPEHRHHRQFVVTEFSDYKITDSKFENGVLMVVGNNRETGDYDRMILRFAKDWSSYDLRKIENITPTGLNFTVLDNGLCISITEDDKVEIFSATKDKASIKSIADPAIDSDMHLCHRANEVQFVKDNKLYSFKMS